jgi:hypothetical protein
MMAHRDGQVITFYSYKGGTGRTMALANVAWILAANGYRVLVVDWDLESPGLHRYFAPFMHPGAVTDTGGVIDLIQRYEWATTLDDPHRGERWHEEYARTEQYAFSLDWSLFPNGATLDFLGAGKEQPDYTAALFGLRWDDFYNMQRGGLFLDALRADMKANYDYTLIDSRTGQSDVADICTSHLPDTVVDCFTLSEQGIAGAVQIARRIQRKKDRPIRILPVPMRIDPAEKEKVDAGRSVAKQRFLALETPLPADISDAERDRYWAGTIVPYQAYYAYEESLATFGDNPGSPGTLLSAYEALTARITNGAVTSMSAIDENARARVNRRFVRRWAVVEDEVTLRYEPEDQVWAEWIEHVLVTVGVRVVPAGPGGQPPASARLLKVISQANARKEEDTIPTERGSARDPLAVYVSELLPVSKKIPLANTATIAGLSAEAAVDTILRLVGRPDGEIDSRSNAAGPRYPGTEPVVFNVPARNVRFTGREGDLEQLRRMLRPGGSAVVISGVQPVALHGMGGIGKTQVAMEYAWRFRSAYDVVWWIDSDPVTFIDSKLVDLGNLLGLRMVGSVEDDVRAVLTSLNQGEPYPRWLIIFDNAEDERVGAFFPAGRGHVIITSRGAAWGERAQNMQVDVFRREESVAHLRKRAPSIRLDEADRVAEVVGDLPIAISAAGAWIADTGTGADEYLVQIERFGPRALPIEGVPDRRVEATWDLSLQRLQERSPAAYRLLQLCSLMAPQIALELIYSDELARVLIPIDPSVSERLVRGALVQHIHRLALLRLDTRGEIGELGERSQGSQVLVHRLLQHVVRSRMSETELADLRHQIHLVLATARPKGDVDDPETWGHFRILWPHLEISEAERCPDESVRRLMIDRVRYLWLRGDLVRAPLRAERTSEAWEEMLRNASAEERPTLRRQLLHLRTNLANVLRDLGQFEQSRELDEQSMREQRETIGEGHPHTLMSASGLAGDRRGLGRYTEALELDLETHAQWLYLFGEQHPRTLAAQSNLAVSYRLVGDFVNALTLDEQVYQRRREAFGENHPQTLMSASNLARDLRDAGEYDRSVALLRTVFDGFTEVLGADSRQALVARVNLAVSLRMSGREHEAAELLSYAYARLNDTLGATNPETLGARLSRAANFHVMGEARLADRETEATRGQYADSLGENHPHTIASLNNLAAAKSGLGDLATAIVLGRRAAEQFAKVLGSRHPYTLLSLTNLGAYLGASGQEREAEEVLRDAAARTVSVLGPEHPNTLRCLANLALVRHRLELVEDGASVSDIYDRLVRRLGSTHPVTVAFRDRRLIERVIDPHPF